MNVLRTEMSFYNKKGIEKVVKSFIDDEKRFRKLLYMEKKVLSH